MTLLQSFILSLQKSIIVLYMYIYHRESYKKQSVMHDLPGPLKVPRLVELRPARRLHLFIILTRVWRRRGRYEQEPRARQLVQVTPGGIPQRV